MLVNSSFTFAPFFNKRSQTVVVTFPESTPNTACRKAVIPSFIFNLTFARWFNSASTASGALPAAHISAVFPSLLCALTSAPRLINSSIISEYPS